jgi:hypothetical protein
LGEHEIKAGKKKTLNEERQEKTLEQRIREPKKEITAMRNKTKQDNSAPKRRKLENETYVSIYETQLCVGTRNIGQTEKRT